MSKKVEIEQYLKSLDGIRRAEPGPFFTGRVLNKLRAGSDSVIRTRLPRWGWSLIVLVALISINIFLLVFQSKLEQAALSEFDQPTPDWVMEYTANPSTPIYGYPIK
jgi:hypothetical protein